MLAIARALTQAVLQSDSAAVRTLTADATVAATVWGIATHQPSVYPGVAAALERAVRIDQFGARHDSAFTQLEVAGRKCGAAQYAPGRGDHVQLTFVRRADGWRLAEIVPNPC